MGDNPRSCDIQVRLSSRPLIARSPAWASSSSLSVWNFSFPKGDPCPILSRSQDRCLPGPSSHCHEVHLMDVPSLDTSRERSVPRGPPCWGPSWNVMFSKCFHATARERGCLHSVPSLASSHRPCGQTCPFICLRMDTGSSCTWGPQTYCYRPSAIGVLLPIPRAELLSRLAGHSSLSPFLPRPTARDLGAAGLVHVRRAASQHQLSPRTDPKDRPAPDVRSRDLHPREPHICDPS